MVHVGIVVGVIVGALAVIAFLTLVIFCCVRNNRKAQERRFIREARVLGIRNAVPLDHLDETQQRAVVVSQLNRTLPPDVNLAEAVMSVMHSQNTSFAGPSALGHHTTTTQIPVGVSSTTTSMGMTGAPGTADIPHESSHNVNSSFTDPSLTGAARYRQPHILELEILLPQPYRMPVLDSANGNDAAATVQVPISHTDDTDNPQLSAEPPSRRSSQLSRLLSRFGGGGGTDRDTQDESNLGQPEEEEQAVDMMVLPYSPSLAEPQQQLWDLYLRKKAVKGEVLHETPPTTPLFYGAHSRSYEARPGQTQVPVHVHTNTNSHSTEPVTPS